MNEGLYYFLGIMVYVGIMNVWILEKIDRVIRQNKTIIKQNQEMSFYIVEMTKEK